MSRLSGWFGSKPTGQTDEEASNAVQDLRDALEATELIMNDDIDGAWEQLKKGNSSFHLLGGSLTFFMQSVIGFEKSVMNEAANRLYECETQAWADLKKAQKQGPRKGSIYPAGAEYELMIAQAQLMAAVIGVLQESLVEGMKSFYRLRKAYLTLHAIKAAEKAAVQQKYANGEITEKTSAAEDESVELQMTDEMDIFIHSGVNMSFGIINLILSMVPPMYSKLLSIVGFSGDRTAGVKMLWRSASHANMNGAMAGLILLTYYNAMSVFVDIVPDERDYDEYSECVGAPVEKCRDLLAGMRKRYPQSGMWRVQDAQLHGNSRQLEAAVEILKGGEKSSMKQIAAMTNFELAVDSMVMQDWNGMRDNFLRCIEVNDWSPALYYYMAGSASLELYRDAVQAGDATEAKLQKGKAMQYFTKSPTVIGKKRLMARKLPVETFIQKRMEKWEARAKKHNADLVDVIASSPAMEMVYLWNGQKRMSEKHVASAIENLKWERCTATKEVLEEVKGEADEIAVWAICMASVKKAVGEWEEARSLLQENVMNHEANHHQLFKGDNDYIMPGAYCELATLSWGECCESIDGEAGVVSKYRKEKVDECEAFLNKARSWESYILEARIGMRVRSGLETIAWFRRKAERDSTTMSRTNTNMTQHTQHTQHTAEPTQEPSKEAAL